MKEEKHLIYENVNSEGYLVEMGMIYPKGREGQFSFIIGYTPEQLEIGNPYFKVYNHPTDYSAATKVLRISFLRSEVIKGHRERNGKREWKLEEFSNHYRKELIDYLNSRSKSNLNITIWTELRLQWNLMKHSKIDDLDDYISGDADKKNLGNPDYVPYNIQMPDYMNLV